MKLIFGLFCPHAWCISFCKTFVWELDNSLLDKLQYQVYIKLFNEILNNNEIGIKYKEQINKQELEKLEQDYFIFSTKKYEDNKYSEADLILYMELIKQHFFHDGIINCPYIEDNNIVDNLLLIPKTIINI